MKTIVSALLFLLTSSYLFSSENDHIPINSELTSDVIFNLESNATSHILRITSNPMKTNAEIKIIHESGAILFQDKFHLDKEIDVSGLRNGLYLIKVYSADATAVKRFYKGRDGVMVK